MTTALPPVTVVAFLTGVGAATVITGFIGKIEAISVPPPHAANVVIRNR